MIPMLTSAEVSALLRDDPWWMYLLKAVVLLVYLLLWALFNVVFERKLVAKMQDRIGPSFNGPNGWGQSLGDGMKLMLKEDFRPKNSDKWVFNLAPYLIGIPAFSIMAVIPFGGKVTIFGEETVLQLTDTPVSVLVILALASVGIYGVVLAGWSSGSSYSLLGGLRSSAQMISYELAMGLSFVAVFMYAGSMATSDIVNAQQQPIQIAGFTIPVEGWFWFLLLPSFVIYLIAMVGETNRAPFDLPECESELVGGFHTEYSGFRFAMFFLAEYLNMVNVSAVVVTLFLGGYHFPFERAIASLNIGWLNDYVIQNAWLQPIWLTLKLVLCICLFVWLRGSLPRFRYDQFMALGWKVLIPVSLVWIMLVALVRLMQGNNVLILLGAAAVVLLLVLVIDGFRKEPDAEEEADSAALSATPFDPYAGGYPVPPMPGQQVPELAGVVPGETETRGTEERADS
nr:NADH-quinone oxidoreductase subunit NuoH [Granulicoccus phenolivorans]